MLCNDSTERKFVWRVCPSFNGANGRCLVLCKVTVEGPISIIKLSYLFCLCGQRTLVIVKIVCTSKSTGLELEIIFKVHKIEGHATKFIFK